jgi:glutamine synthetase
MSLWKGDVNITVDKEAKHQIGSTANSFVASILEALPPMISILCPTYNGLKRLQPSACVGAIVAWGVENKEAPLRFLPNHNNIELKTLDHTANHYYVLATIINLGLIGISEKKLLPEPVPKSSKFNLFQMLPSRWDEIVNWVESDKGELLKKAMGEELCDLNMKVRGYDIDHYFKFSLAEEIKELTIRY